MLKFFTSSQSGDLNIVAIWMFLIFVAVTLYITFWAAKKHNQQTISSLLVEIFTGLQNGLAISGDFMSAASFLGYLDWFFYLDLMGSSIQLVF